VVDPFGDGRGDAVTKYFYRNPAWPDGVTRIEYPADAGQTARFDSIGYDAFGRIVSREDGRAGSRTTFAYYGQTTDGVSRQLRSITYPAVAGAPAAVDSFVQGFLGNVTKVKSANGAWTEYHNDNIGRAKAIGHDITLNPSGGPSTFSSMQSDSTVFDILGRDSLTVSIGPAVSPYTEQRLSALKFFDAEGNLIRVQRWGETNGAADAVNVLSSRWGYDRAGRQVTDSAQRGVAGAGGYDIETRYYDLAGNVDSVKTRRAGAPAITMTYDALNRLLTRTIPQVSYAERLKGIPQRLASLHIAGDTTYPRLLKDGSGGLTIDQVVESYTYDQSGQILTANNRYAQVTRGYFPSGAMRREVQRISKYNNAAGNDFTARSDTVAYDYRVDGALKTLTYPTRLTKTAGGTYNTVQYRYSTVSGVLDTIVDLQGNTFAYHHNLRDQVDSVVMPGQIRRRLRYNADGSVLTDTIRNLDSTSVNRLTAGLLRANRFTYDARGKIVGDTNTVGSLSRRYAKYSGLGHLRETGYQDQIAEGGSTGTFSSTDFYTVDALGNTTIDAAGVTQAGVGFWARYFEFNANRHDDTMQPGVGRLVLSKRFTTYPDSFRVDSMLYDGAGNLEFSYTRTGDESEPGATAEDRAAFYGLDGHLRVVDHRIARIGAASVDVPLSMDFEEYWYDALGRRVLTRTRRACVFQDDYGPCGVSTIRRTVWNGGQEIIEIQQPGYDNSSAAELENDTAFVAYRGPYGLPSYDTNRYFGRVAYTFGPGVDQPVSATRWGFQADSFNTGGVSVLFTQWREPFTIVPQWNARSDADNGTFSDGTAKWCNQATVVSSGAPSSRCVVVAWAAGWTGFQQKVRQLAAWHGTMLEQKRDGSGLLYRRNRYVDPSTGRFTQEDPIGLAGGINLYGFAAGDPVNFSDPFGLCPGTLGSGQICLDFFISTPTTLFGLLKGDNRGFQQVSDVSRSRAYAIIDPNSGSIAMHVNPSCSGSGSGCKPSVNGPDAFTVKGDGHGGFNVHVDIVNSKVPGPHINADFSITPDGKGGYNVSGTRDGYPSFEAYYYRKDGSVQTIIQQLEGKPRQLWGSGDTKIP
jgi:RHS repeat-associated protein